MQGGSRSKKQKINKTQPFNLQKNFCRIAPTTPSGERNDYRFF
ncbi:MAG: hypothetical protein CM15mV81_120 [uncultured marine virus]|nr:MAG: hypothetical protein CM15mV81_120 [uncultured marine virus]